MAFHKSLREMRLPAAGFSAAIGGHGLASDQRQQSTPVALQSPCELKFEQHRAHYGGRGAGHPDQIIQQNRARPEQTDHSAAIGRVWFGCQPLVTPPPPLHPPAPNRVDPPYHRRWLRGERGAPFY